jgi:predicted cupin superfamily sugar epimerase
MDVVEKAAYRARAAGRMHHPRGGLQLTTTVSDLREEDSLKVARAAATIVTYLVELKRLGWITDRKAMELAYKFAGEVIDVEAMLRELQTEAGTDTAAPPEETNGDS